MLILFYVHTFLPFPYLISACLYTHQRANASCCVSKQQTPIKAAVGISHVSPSNNSLHTFEKFPSELRRLVCDNPRGFSLTKAEKFNQLLRQPRGELVQNFSTGEGSVEESSRKFSFRSL